MHDGLTGPPELVLLHDRLVPALARRARSVGCRSCWPCSTSTTSSSSTTPRSSGGDELLVELARGSARLLRTARRLPGSGRRVRVWSQKGFRRARAAALLPTGVLVLRRAVLNRQHRHDDQASELGSASQTIGPPRATCSVTPTRRSTGPRRRGKGRSISSTPRWGPSSFARSSWWQPRGGARKRRARPCTTSRSSRSSTADSGARGACPLDHPESGWLDAASSSRWPKKTD